MKFIFSIIGGYIGAIIDSYAGFCFGALIGFLFAYVFELKKALHKLEEKISIIESNLIDSNVMVDDSISDGIQVDNIELEEVSIDQDVIDPDEITQINPAYKENYSEPEAEEPQPTSREEGVVDRVNTAERWVLFIKNFFTTGNVVVKTGVIILFFGVAFLLKYAAQRHAISADTWLIVVTFGAIGLLLFGWKLRHIKPNYALAIQGGAIGILYITIFTAANRFHLLPLATTFILMLCLVVCSCILAVLQNSRSLACLATIGGFLAPVLTASGTGSHIALFSYYAVLNAGIFVIAWFKAWRILNWLGFVFTFVIASLWGHDSYQAEYFNTTEPFLILFFLYYIGISILFAYKQVPHLKGLVDGSLVFGVPLVGFTLQSLLVQDYEYGQAISALLVGILYFSLARWLWHKQTDGMRLLAESFLSLGVIFMSLAIPFTFDGNLTAAVWALEGAGISWIGIRQRRLLARLFGIMLQLGGGFVFLISNLPTMDSIPVFNSAYLGSFLLSIGGLFSAFVFYKYRMRLKLAEQLFHRLLLIWGLLWWFCSGIIEIDNYVSSEYEVNTVLSFVAISMLIISLIARTLSWKSAEHPPILLLPVMYGIAFIQILNAPSGNILADYGFLSWILAFSIQILILYRCDHVWSNRKLSLWHILTMYLYMFLWCWIIADLVNYLLPDGQVWEDVIWGLIPALGILKMTYLRDRLSWPVMDYPQSYVGSGLFPVVCYLGLWIILSCHEAGDPSPLRYITVFNPLELVQLLCLITMLNWMRLVKRGEIPKILFLTPSLGFNTIGFISFIWITSVIAHSVHFYSGVRFDESAMLGSEIFQTSISIVWTLTAFIVMWAGTKQQLRKIWFVGACLLGVVVIKLFLIDLANSGGIAQIVSFMTVGILVLIIGYFSPIPPKTTACSPSK